MKRFEHGVIEVAETIHGNHIGTSCDYFGPGEFEKLRDWLRWRVTEAWEPTKAGATVAEIQYNYAVRSLAFAALRLGHE